ncbi:MAG TPA: DedA family protein [Azospirillaceae bacterium]|nr:DedA family protein [Azospirillaceae bacterium]
MIEWITETVASAGALGVALLMALENLFPPIPSELIMPLAGFAAAQGKLNLWVAIAAGTVGSVVGTLPWYFAARKLGKRRVREFVENHGCWIAISAADVDKASDFLRRHGRGALLFGRLVPGVRTLISVPAGVASVPLGFYLIYSAIGSAVWTAVLTIAGYLLRDRYEKVAHLVDPVAQGVLALLVGWYVWRVFRCRRECRKRRQAGAA